MASIYVEYEKGLKPLGHCLKVIVKNCMLFWVVVPRNFLLVQKLVLRSFCDMRMKVEFVAGQCFHNIFLRCMIQNKKNNKNLFMDVKYKRKPGK